jgi:hypothetical protein
LEQWKRTSRDEKEEKRLGGKQASQKQLEAGRGWNMAVRVVVITPVQPTATGVPKRGRGRQKQTESSRGR